MMNREEAEKLIRSLTTNENLIKHLYGVEAVMRSLARKFGEDENLWGLSGLLHDADYEVTRDLPQEHTLVLEESLRNYDVPGELIRSIKAHNRIYTHQNPASKLDWALICADDITGLIIATALVMPDKRLVTVKADSVEKKFKDKTFAKGVDRERIKLCEEKLKLPLAEFVKLSLEALQSVAVSLRL